MSLFPEEPEARAFADARALFQWVGLEADDITALEAEAGSMSNSIRNLALLPAGDVKLAVEAAKFADGSQLPPIKRAQFGLAWRIARRLMAAQWSVFADVDPLDSGTPQGSSGATGVPSALAMASQQPPATMTRKLKVNVVLDQADDSELAVAGDAEVARWHANWQAFAQGPPEPEEEQSNSSQP